ncbi:MAG TPA: hypothetical protein VK662_14200, partial [Acidothermaceae bacterium]|nr:hypothetical protein [Acidothermaceae bacterium]
MALKRRYRWPLSILFSLTFRIGFAVGWLGIVILFIERSDVLLAALMIVVGTGLFVVSFSIYDRIISPTWVVDHRADTVR